MLPERGSAAEAVSAASGTALVPESDMTLEVSKLTSSPGWLPTCPASVTTARADWIVSAVTADSVSVLNTTRV